MDMGTSTDTGVCLHQEKMIPDVGVGGNLLATWIARISPRSRSLPSVEAHHRCWWQCQPLGPSTERMGTKTGSSFCSKQDSLSAPPRTLFIEDSKPPAQQRPLPVSDNICCWALYPFFHTHFGRPNGSMGFNHVQHSHGVACEGGAQRASVRDSFESSWRDVVHADGPRCQTW
ncbi:unnamed protein product [Prorocentrum cordatum]|uniref:Uncharacterized protein n=1 Tax=Prorocentrum cordatum TaxID=2364126 RepID=A0ABN9XI16_9DINO|nr:unnamed protein product [Polarella glacialis]